MPKASSPLGNAMSGKPKKEQKPRSLSSPAFKRNCKHSETPTDTTLIDAECKRLSTALEHLERRDELQVALETANEAVSDADLVVKKTMAGYLRSEAPRMAAQLEDGEPCVVCGATEHPGLRRWWAMGLL